MLLKCNLRELYSTVDPRPATLSLLCRVNTDKIIYKYPTKKSKIVLFHIVNYDGIKLLRSHNKL
jgi:hypothetical protein